MSRYRFVTPHRTGKWYPDLGTAQAHACEIGAGFLDARSGRFVAYLGTKLQVRRPAESPSENAQGPIQGMTLASA